MAKTIHAVVRTDEMLATTASAGLYSVKYNDGTDFADIDNGHVVALDSLMKNEREIWKAVTPAANSDIKQIVLIATPEVMHDERLRNLSDFYNEAGIDARGYMLHSGDIFSVTAEALDGADTDAKGKIVELQADTKMKVVSAATSGSTAIGSIVDIETVGALTYYVIRVA